MCILKYEKTIPTIQYSKNKFSSKQNRTFVQNIESNQTIPYHNLMLTMCIILCAHTYTLIHTRIKSENITYWNYFSLFHGLGKHAHSSFTNPSSISWVILFSFFLLDCSLVLPLGIYIPSFLANAQSNSIRISLFYYLLVPLYLVLHWILLNLFLILCKFVQP